MAKLPADAGPGSYLYAACNRFHLDRRAWRTRYEGGDRAYRWAGRLESASGAQAHAEGKKKMKQQKKHATDAAPFIKPCEHGAERTRDRPPY